MSETSSHRLRWWLRAERAFGLHFVHTGAGQTVPEVPASEDVFAEDVAAEDVAAEDVAAEDVVADEPKRYAAPLTVSVTTPAALETSRPPAMATVVAAAAPQMEAFESVELPTSEKAAALQLLDEQSVRQCVRCALSKTRRHTVFGEGDPTARLVFVGEGPGATEDQTGRPFVGRAGQKLDEMIAAMGMGRPQVYICNVVKCRAFVAQPTPKDRPPLPEEAGACIPYLHRQIEIIRPAVLVTLGLSAAQHLLGVKLSMSRMRGNWYSWRGIPVMPTFHPSYILRNYTTETRRAVWEDLKKVVQKLGTTAASGAA